MNSNRDKSEIDFFQKPTTEYITPHKLSVVCLIAEYIKLRDEDIEVCMKPGVFRTNLPPKLIRDFALLTLNLIHGPDLTFAELYSLLTSGKYSLMPGHLENYVHRIKQIIESGVNNFMDLSEFWVNKVGRAYNRSEFLVFKTSVVGYYLRRFILSVEKLEFSELIRILEHFKIYFESDYEKLTANTSENITPESMELTNLSGAIDETTELNSNMSTNIEAKFSNLYIDIEHSKCSRRQAELFLATQATLLKNNEEAALPPPILQQKIRSLLKNNPGFSEAHFLSYLNCLRVKEYCGAIDSLYHSFDRNTAVDNGKSSSSEEKSDGSFRYAALNLAILHAQFGHKEEALAALKEAIMKAQEANDNFCLQHALTWMYKLTDNKNKELLIERSILKSNELNLNYNTSLGIQAYTQYMGLHGGKPKYIFDLLTKSDVINCQHSLIELLSNSYAEKAALWKLYGKQELCTLWSQILLYTKSDHIIRGCVSYNGEGICQAICNIAINLTFNGDYEKSQIVLNHARERFVNEPLSHIWMYCEYFSCFTQAYHNQLWQNAEIAARKIASFDEWESRLYLAEIYLAKNNYESAVFNVNSVLNYTQTTTKDILNKIDLKVRAMILLVEIKCAQFSQGHISTEVTMILNEALEIADRYYLKYYTALIQLHIAHVQLWMKMPQHALQLINKALITILANGGLYDRARAMLLYVKCLVAKVNTTNDPNRTDEIENCAVLLEKVKANFEKVQAYSRVKDVIYLQAKLYDNINLIEDRNRCAADFKRLIEKYPTISESQLLLTAL